MTRTLKALGLALLAVCALSAVVASSASAAKDIITCTGVEKCDVTATGEATFVPKGVPGVSVKCAKETYSGTVTSGAESVTVSPTYHECTVLGGGATIDTTGCNYIITSATTSNTHTTGDTTTDAPVHVECTGSNKIKITGPACTISVGPQGPLHGVTFDTEGSGSTDDLKITVTVDTIHYTTSGFGCAIAGLPGTGTDGTLTGFATAKGYTHNSAHGTGNHVGLTDHSV